MSTRPFQIELMASRFVSESVSLHQQTMCPLLNITLFTEIRILRAILVFASICGA